MNISVLIPARISSKRLPRKNIRPLNGKPLLFWSIDVALEADCFDTICVSTENRQVADLVKRHYPGKNVTILMRPEALSTDTADLRDVCRHFLDEFTKVDMLCLMMPTYPFRSVRKIRNDIIPAVFSGQVSRVVSVLPKSFSTFDYWIKSSGCYVRMFREQPLWSEAGNAAYTFMKRECFFNPPHHWEHDIWERELKVSTDFKESLDIDTEKDWSRAEKIATGWVCKQRKLKKEVIDGNEFIGPDGMDLLGFKKYLSSRDCDFDQPILVLGPPPPYFTFLRLPSMGGEKNYQRPITREIVANLPDSGHSQVFPQHFIHSSSYRVLRILEDSRSGIMERTVSDSQVILYSELKKWSGFVAHTYWEKAASDSQFVDWDSNLVLGNE